jgi:hypothetical protein
MTQMGKIGPLDPKGRTLGDTRFWGIPQGPGEPGDLFFIKDKIKHVIDQKASFWSGEFKKIGPSPVGPSPASSRASQGVPRSFRRVFQVS